MCWVTKTPTASTKPEPTGALMFDNQFQVRQLVKPADGLLVATPDMLLVAGELGVAGGESTLVHS